MPEHCPFCATNWENLDIVERPDSNPETLIIRPLNPVVEGHVLVICKPHTANASADASVAQHLMYLAARYVARHQLQANIITSVGPDATQTVFHTHVHVVPRRPGDGLPLPWTGQKKAGEDK
ncbi:histidine triad nucleotide binding protein [Mycobacterium phage Avani]|uniref:Histidine triad nucleotide binding protein n=1 Tax=Mycobacterium phage Avani TaxID=2902841 RepID=I3WWW3_9CAUD|nr:histidine triad nucleotide binding protein [Mycobacterium phage Avani]AFL47991.1 histidine triad nucleotide binding protein [Mycobacterium phage Avani]